jgi:DNA-binding response OmpR family regulator
MTEVKDLESVRILIIDDDAAQLFLARRALEQAGFLVEEAADGKLGLRAIKETRPDLVLLDVMMPEFNGYDVCLELRRDPEFMNLPVVMVTALDDLDSVRRAFEAGATNFVTKPVNWTILSYHVKYILRANQKAEELHRTKQLLALAHASADETRKKQKMVVRVDLEQSEAMGLGIDL